MYGFTISDQGHCKSKWDPWLTNSKSRNFDFDNSEWCKSEKIGINVPSIVENLDLWTPWFLGIKIKNGYQGQEQFNWSE